MRFEVEMEHYTKIHIKKLPHGTDKDYQANYLEMWEPLLHFVPDTKTTGVFEYEGREYKFFKDWDWVEEGKNGALLIKRKSGRSEIMAQSRSKG